MVDITTKIKELALNAGAKVGQAVGQVPTVGNADNKGADKSTTFKGYAALAAGAVVSPWEYHPHKLDQAVSDDGTGAKDFVEIKISHCGVCGSDLHTITAGWGGCTYPQIVGHEIVGEITAVGPDVKTLKVGDRVGVGAQCWSCGQKDCDACPHGNENICPKMTGTYDGNYPDGFQTHGGYADRTRVCERFVFKLPEKIKSEEAGPLMCAGVTVYAPLKRCGVKEGTKVGVIGIGGLGHLAIQFAAALGADVTAISTSTRKKEDALKMGAKHFLVSKDEEQVKEAARRFEVIICTANGGDNDYKTWMSLIAPRGRFANVGMPDGLKLPIPIAVLGSCEGEYVASMIGSPQVIREMLEFAAEKGVKPWIERLPMADANKALEKIRTGDVKYRVVLCN